MIGYRIDGKTVYLPDELWTCIKSLPYAVLDRLVRAYTAPCEPSTPMYKYERMDGTWVIPRALYSELGPLNWQEYSKTVMSCWVRDNGVYRMPSPEAKVVAVERCCNTCGYHSDSYRGDRCREPEYVASRVPNCDSESRWIPKSAAPGMGVIPADAELKPLTDVLR